MTARRPLWSRSCLCQLSSLRASRQDLPTGWSRVRTQDRRRHLASVATNDAFADLKPDLSQIQEQEQDQKKTVKNRQSRTAPASDEASEASLGTGYLDQLLSAIQRKDTAATSANFLEWTNILGDPTSPSHSRVVQQFMNLTSPVLSEVIRSMDPIRHPELDKAYAMNITQGHTKFTDAGKLMDKYGVRIHHRRVLQGMLTIMAMRENARYGLRAADFDVFLRCAGAAVDYRFAAIIFGAMASHGLLPHRTDKTWSEFIKARFMIEPTYYQYDRSRIAVDPRNLVKHIDLLEGHQETIKRMDRVRLSTNAFMRQPWNRRPDEPGEDIRRLLSRSGETIKMTMAELDDKVEGSEASIWEEQQKMEDKERAEEKATKDPNNVKIHYQDYRSFWRHWFRQWSYPNNISEEMASAGMIGFSRSGDRRAILEVILQNHYGIQVDEENQSVTGGSNLQQDSALYPTGRLLNAIVESFGSMSEISLAMQLVDFVSQRYNVPIPHYVWSNLLNWSYLSASKNVQNLRRMYGDDDHTRVDAQDVIHVWNIMTSEPYSIQPSFEDLEIHIKTLIITRRHEDAITLIRNSAMPYYHSLVDTFESAVCEEILLKDANLDPSTTSFTASTISQAVRHRQDAETRKDYVHNRIAIWFADLLKEHSKARSARMSHASTTTIPNLVRDFPNFFLTGVRYRTATGYVSIRMVDETSRYKWKSEGRVARDVIGTKLSSADVPRDAVDKYGVPRRLVDEDTGQSYENPDFTWPTNHSMRVVENRKTPRRRIDDLARPPGPKEEQERRKWWGMLEMQLMM